VLINPGNRGGEGLAMGSPFFWAGYMSFELAQSRSASVPNLHWAVFWLIVAAVMAVAVLAFTLANFDRCLGRIESVLTRLGRPPRWIGIVAPVYFVLAMILSFCILFWHGQHELMASANGLQFTVGLLLLVATAVTSLADSGRVGKVNLSMSVGLSPARIVLAKWLGACRLMPLVVLPPLLVVVGRAAAPSGDWRGLLVAVAYMLSMSAAAISLGVASAGWYWQRSRIYGLLAAFTALIAVGGLALSSTLVLFPGNQGLYATNPLLGVGLLTLEAEGMHSLDLDFTKWGLVWALGGVFCAIVLLVPAITTFDRCLGRGLHKGRFGSAAGDAGEEQQLS
jgi:hypothetical protein